MNSDFEFLPGNFDVTGPRRNDLLDPDSGGAEVPATSAAVIMSGGGVSIEEMWFATEQSFGFVDGIGTFHGVEQLTGHRVEIWFIWSDITCTSARWGHSFRVGGGAWDDNWEMTFARSSAQVAS